MQGEVGIASNPRIGKGEVLRFAAADLHCLPGNGGKGTVLLLILEFLHDLSLLE